MALVVELRHESGQRIVVKHPRLGKVEAAGDFDRVLRHAETGTLLLLQYVDEYGDTVFNKLQMEHLLHDIHTLAQQAQTPNERRGLDRLEVLAVACRDSVHHYVWFLGD